MEEIIISMEATCDLPKEIIEKHNFQIVNMDFMINDEVYSTGTDNVKSTNLYEKMKNGSKTSTSQVNEQLYTDFFEEQLKAGKKILHIAFSSGLSKTYDCAVKSASVLNQKYGQKIYVVDSLCACSGHGFLGILASEYVEKAKNINDLVNYVEKIKMQVCHDFTVDNLKYLAAGGRVKATTAFVGNILNIKPIMKMDNEGHLCSCSKVISRKKSLTTLYKQFFDKKDNDCKVIFISHADSLDDAMVIYNLVKENTDFEPIVTDLGPVIGSHSGPGTIALFYLSDQR